MTRLSIAHARALQAQHQASAASGRRTGGGTWPGLSSNVSKVFDAVLKGSRIPASLNLQEVTVRHYSYFHRIVLATNNNMTTTNTLFNVSYAPGVTNLPQAGFIPNDTAFALEAIRVRIDTGITLAGAGEAAGAHIVSGATVPMSALEALRIMLGSGQLQVKIGDKVIADQYDLYHFAAGRGPVTAAAVSDSTANTAKQICSLVNGPPIRNAGWLNRPAYPVLPSKQISATCNWQAALTLPASTTYILQVDLEGTLVTPSNL